MIMNTPFYNKSFARVLCFIRYEGYRSVTPLDAAPGSSIKSYRYIFFPFQLNSYIGCFTLRDLQEKPCHRYRPFSALGANKWLFGIRDGLGCPVQQRSSSSSAFFLLQRQNRLQLDVNVLRLLYCCLSYSGLTPWKDMFCRYDTIKYTNKSVSSVDGVSHLAYPGKQYNCT